MYVLLYTIHRSIHGLSSVWLSFIWGMPRLVWNVMINTAKTYLDKVRTRAGIPTVETSWNGIATLDQAKLREIVRQERTIEFYLENQTFWDLRRWKQAAEYFGVKAKGMNIAGKTIDEFAQETEVSFERKFESPTQYLMPVPLTDVNRNMNLVQNPGY